MALIHSGIVLGTGVEIKYIQSASIKENDLEAFENLDGIVIPGGFGHSGFEGKINAARMARESNLPALMIGLGAQAAAIEFARNVMGLSDADSTEFEKRRLIR